MAHSTAGRCKPPGGSCSWGDLALALDDAHGPQTRHAAGEPGVIGQIGTLLGKQGVNIATFALGRREAVRGAEALALVRLDGDVPASVVEPIRGIPAVVEARLVRLDNG